MDDPIKGYQNPGRFYGIPPSRKTAMAEAREALELYLRMCKLHGIDAEKLMAREMEKRRKA